jgi:hypothetical protein
VIHARAAIGPFSEAAIEAADALGNINNKFTRARKRDR